VTLFQILSKTSTPSWTFLRTRSISPCSLRLAPILLQSDHFRASCCCLCFYYHSILFRNWEIEYLFACLIFRVFFFFLLLCWVEIWRGLGKGELRGRWILAMGCDFLFLGLGFLGLLSPVSLHITLHHNYNSIYNY
jgi:hypothetical protein